MRTYTGIGSRQTPEEVLALMSRIAARAAVLGYVLRSGGAPGADKAFEEGCDAGDGQKEIYLPWKGFNQNPSPLFNISPEALELAERFHPNWAVCSPAARKLHARNGYQVLGLDLKSPSQMLICWTKAGVPSGGTGQALRIAYSHSVRVYNLGFPETFEQWDDWYGRTA